MGVPVVLVNTGVSGKACSGLIARSKRTVSGNSSAARRAVFVFGAL
jgi:hypothetical protein